MSQCLNLKQVLEKKTEKIILNIYFSSKIMEQVIVQLLMQTEMQLLSLVQLIPSNLIFI